MNNTFDINRFGLLLRRQWLEFGKIYLITLGVAFGVIASFYLFNLWNTFFVYDEKFLVSVNFREPLFIIFGFLFITVIASNYYANLGQKSKTIIELLLPASTFEKFLAGVFFTAILSVIGYMVVFYIADLIFMSKLREMIPESATGRIYSFDMNSEKVTVDVYGYIFDTLKRGMLLPFYAVPFFVTSIFLLGSIYFNKYHYIKTAVSVMLFSGLAGYIIVHAGEYIMRNRRPIDITGFHFGKSSDMEMLVLLIAIVLTIVFWAITYVRVKEKEV